MRRYRKHGWGIRENIQPSRGCLSLIHKHIDVIRVLRPALKKCNICLRFTSKKFKCQKLRAMKKPVNRGERWLWGFTIFLVATGILIVVRRILFLIDLGSPGKYSPGRSPIPDVGFASHPFLTLIHIVTGLVFMLLAPLQFIKRLRDGYPKVHRFTGYIVLASGLVIGSTALTMGIIMAIGGTVETLAVTTYGTLFLFSLAKAYLYIMKRETALHREWMIRALAIGLAVSTTRPIVGIFFGTSRFTGLTVHQYFGVAFWIAFTLHLLVAELWIRSTREKMAIPATRPSAS